MPDSLTGKCPNKSLDIGKIPYNPMWEKPRQRGTEGALALENTSPPD